ncbi:immunoglobulin lambda-1 light chain [Etheostoma spectabile]|uniref:immunoglobulin lambda-1 light chain n=1 Tax=Etheostoma spectabile TaxID=54343 RepID=UPI0013AF6676|nr:immunoglobulin lambda-1 light chain-like [Etheostoma spectabile]
MTTEDTEILLIRNMTRTSVLIWTLLCCCFSESRGQVTVTQPGAVSSARGASVSISCKVNPEIPVGDSSFGSNKGKHVLHWYQHRDGEAPKPLIYFVNVRASGISDRFSGSGSNSDFTLTISGVEAEDAAVYYCQSKHYINSQLWYTFGGGTRLELGCDVRPTLTVLPPSREELQQGKATLMCLANKGFPSDWSLAWKVDGSSSSSSSSWEESRSPGVLEDGHYSWSSTLRLPADQWRKVGSVTCEATQGSQTPLSETLRRDQCSQS